MSDVLIGQDHPKLWTHAGNFAVGEHDGLDPVT